MLRLDGKVVADARRAVLKTKIAHFTETHGRKPGLAVVIVGEDPASQVYVRNKVKTTTELGMHSTHLELPNATTQDELLKIIAQLNGDTSVDGILVQLPLPKHIDTTAVVEAIKPEKDPD